MQYTLPMETLILINLYLTSCYRSRRHSDVAGSMFVILPSLWQIMYGVLQCIMIFT